MGEGWFRREGDIIALNLYVQPGAKRSEVAGIHGTSLKIRLAAPPVEGRANEALLKFIAGLFEVPLRQVTLHHGERSRYKEVRVKCSCVTPDSIITA